MNLALWLHRAGLSHGDRPALGLGARVIRRYSEVAGRAAKLAAALRERFGLQAGERVAIAAKNCPDYVELMFGIWHAGLAAVPANAKLHGRELGYILQHSGARVCFASEGVDAEIASHAPSTLEHLIVIGSHDYEMLFASDPIAPWPCHGDDLAWLFYTSGTTGRPKGAMLTHRVLAAASFAYASEVNPIAPGSPLLHAAPMSHGSGLYIMPHVMRLGLNVVPESGGFQARRDHGAHAALEGGVDVRGPDDAQPPRGRAGGLRLPLPAHHRLGRGADVCRGRDPGARSFRAASGADLRAGREPHDHLASAGGRGPDPSPLGASASPAPAGPSPAWDVAIAGPEGGRAGDGEPGEILCRGTPVMPGYWNAPDASAEALRGGWLHTGDVGLIDAHGYVVLKDRSKDLIISGISNIYPREVEEVLLTHPRVREASVIGRPDREWGEIVVACIVGEATPAELDALCLASIARFKRPKDYVLMRELPKNNYGKVLKTALREADAARPRRESEDG